MLNYLKAYHSILGLNERNLMYTLPENSPKARIFADNKLKAKEILREVDIPVPETYAVIGSKEKLDKFKWDTLPSSFVLKPNKGFGGQGIIVLYGEKKRKTPDEPREWILADGSRMSISDLSKHIMNILEGNFSLKNKQDKAFFEYRLKNITSLKPYLYKGVPSIRIVVYNKIPVMADIKLPTKESQGKANLHAGGVLVGIDMATGRTTNAIQHDKLIELHPDKKIKISGIRIPYWTKILEMAVRAQIATELGYLGVDVAIDPDLGPVILEINARPGLGTQIANRDGLKERLQRIARLKVKTIQQGVLLGKQIFGGEIEEEVETLLGKKVVGRHATAFFTGKDNKQYETQVKVDTGAYFSSIDIELAKQLGFEDVLHYYNELNLPTNDIDYSKGKDILAEYKPKINKKYGDLFTLSLIKSGNGISIRPMVQTEVSLEGVKRLSRFTIINREHLKHPAIIGARDLRSFVVDPSKRPIA